MNYLRSEVDYPVLPEFVYLSEISISLGYPLDFPRAFLDVSGIFTLKILEYARNVQKTS